MYRKLAAKEFLEDAMDQLNETRDVALLCLAKYQKALCRYHNQQVRG